MICTEVGRARAACSAPVYIVNNCIILLFLDTKGGWDTHNVPDNEALGTQSLQLKKETHKYLSKVAGEPKVAAKEYIFQRIGRYEKRDVVF